METEETKKLSTSCVFSLQTLTSQDDRVVCPMAPPPEKADVSLGLKLAKDKKLQVLFLGGDSIERYTCICAFINVLSHMSS